MEFLENKVHMSNVIHFTFSYIISMISLYYFMETDQMMPFIIFAVFAYYSLLKLCAILAGILLDIILYNIDSRFKAIVHILGNHVNMKKSGELYSTIVDKIIDLEDQMIEEDEHAE